MGQTTHLAWTCRDVWFGPSSIVAIIGSILHAEPYQLQSLVMNVVAVQAIGFVYLLARYTLDFGRLGSSVLALLYALNPVVLFTIWQSFGGQMFAMSLMLAVFFIQTHFLRDIASRNSDLGYVYTAIILFTGIILSYHYMVLISAMLMAANIFWYAFFSRQWPEVRRAAAGLLLAFVVCLLLNPLRVKGLIDTLGMLNSNNGWFIPWLSPDVIMGANADTLLVGTGDLADRNFWAIVSTVAFLLTARHLFINKQNIGVRSFVLGLVVPAMLVGFWYAYSERQNGIWGSYRSFKITASFSALTLLAGAIAFAGCSWKNQRLLTVLAAGFLALSASASWNSMRALARFTQEHAFVPGPELFALKKIESLPSVKGINVMDADNFSLLWTNYFTLKTRQVYQRFPYGGRPVGPLSQEYSLAKDIAAARAVGHSEEIFSVEASSFSAEHVISAWYSLYRAHENRDVTITPAEGWWPAEPKHRWSGSKGTLCSVYIDSNSENTKIFLEASFMELPVGRHISASLNGAPLNASHDRQHLRTQVFPLSRGRNLVEFHTSFMPDAPTSWDPRTLSIAWTAVVVRFPPLNHNP